jgi:starch-binding outer membrane protein SusE/F
MKNMKKLSLYMLLFAFVLAGCSADENADVASPQSWAQEKLKNVTFSATALANPINLANVTTDSVAVCSFTAPVLPDTLASITGYDIVLDNARTLSVNSKGQVNKDSLQLAIEKLYGKRPIARTLSGVVRSYISLKGQTFLASSSPISVVVTPKAPFIDSAYYLVGDMSGWSADKLIKFTHSTKDVYEDPVFTTIVKVSAGNYWKIVPQTNVTGGNIFAEGTTGVVGCVTNGDTSLSGSLTTTSPQAMKIATDGYVKITLNMMDYTYTVESVAPYLYVPGNHQNWTPATAPYLYSTDYQTYSGFINLNGAFKFTSVASWSGTNYGVGASSGTLSTDASAGNLNASPAGLYFLSANIPALTYTMSQITTMGLIGDATAGGWNTSTPMTYDATGMTYTVTATLAAGSFKFRANDAWAINLGGDKDNLTLGGDNMSVAAGTYAITLYLSNPAQYHCTIVAQ